jgi:hypothetical protein
MEVSVAFYLHVELKSLSRFTAKLIANARVSQNNRSRTPPKVTLPKIPGGSLSPKLQFSFPRLPRSKVTSIVFPCANLCPVEHRWRSERSNYDGLRP